jgi:hypothetical protein
VLAYRDYLNHAQSQQGSEGTNEAMSEERWNALDDDAKWNLLGGNIGIGPDDPRYAELKKQVGGEANRVIQISRKPVADGDLVDPARQVKGEGWTAHSEDNQTPEYQDRIGMSGNALKMFLLTAAAITGAAAMAGAFSAPATSALGAAPGQGFGTLGYQGAAGIAEAGATGATSAASNNLTGGDLPAGTEAPNAYSPNADPTAFHEPIGNAPSTPSGPSPAAPGGTQPPAPVTNSAPPVPGTNNGIINNALAQGRSVVNAGSQWYNGLSPASRLILGQAVGQGVSALMGASAQREAQQAAEEREEQEREDRRRRTAIPDFSGAFKPRGNSKTGIIDGLRRPGGS